MSLITFFVMLSVLFNRREGNRADTHTDLWGQRQAQGQICKTALRQAHITHSHRESEVDNSNLDIFLVNDTLGTCFDFLM